MERGRKKRRDNRKSHGIDRKIMDEETVYKGAFGNIEKENNTPHEASTKTTNTKMTKNHLPLPKTLYSSPTSVPIPKTHPTPTTITTQMKMPSNGEPSTTPHAAMHWSACFEDRCDVHLRDKEGANRWPKEPRRNQPRRAAKTVRWGEPATPEEQHHQAGKLVDDLQEEMLRMAEEMGCLKEENRGLKKRVVLAEESARKAGIEARRRAYESVELKIRIRRAVRGAAALVREIDHDNEYSKAVGLPPKERTPNGSPTNGDTKDDVQKYPEETNGASGWYRIFFVSLCSMFQIVYLILCYMLKMLMKARRVSS